VRRHVRRFATFGLDRRSQRGNASHLQTPAKTEMRQQRQVCRGFFSTPAAERDGVTRRKGCASRRGRYAVTDPCARVISCLLAAAGMGRSGHVCPTVLPRLRWPNAASVLGLEMTTQCFRSRQKEIHIDALPEGFEVNSLSLRPKSRNSLRTIAGQWLPIPTSSFVLLESKLRQRPRVHRRRQLHPLISPSLLRRSKRP